MSNNENKNKRFKKLVIRATIETKIFGQTVHPDDYKEFFEAISKKPKERTKSDMELLKLMIRNVQALQIIPPRMFDGICRHIIHKHFPRKELVAKKGDVAEEAFIVANGIIQVEIKNGLVVHQYNPGDFFGDYGLQKESAVRTADCRARTDVDVICIPKQIFIKYMLNYMYGNQELKKKFFVKELLFPIFPKKPKNEEFTEQMNWMVAAVEIYSYDVFILLYTYGGLQSYNKGNVIGLQGHPSKKIFWVANGRIRVLKTITIEGQTKVCDVGYYRKGQAFGANYSSINETNVHTWIADGPTTLYTIKRGDFQRFFGHEMVKMYKESTNMLECPVREIRGCLRNQKKWNEYKKQVINAVMHGARTDGIELPKINSKYNQCKIYNI